MSLPDLRLTAVNKNTVTTQSKALVKHGNLRHGDGSSVTAAQRRSTREDDGTVPVSCTRRLSASSKLINNTDGNLHCGKE